MKKDLNNLQNAKSLVLAHLRRSTIEIIESTPSPKIEHRFIKYPGYEAIDITDYIKSNAQEAFCDINIVEKVLKDNLKLTDIHTHPNKIDGNVDVSTYNALPSANDMKRFMNRMINTMVIAVRDVESGRVFGYHIFKKTKHTKELEGENLIDEIKIYAFSLEVAAGLGQPLEVWEQSFDPAVRAKSYNEVLNKFVKRWNISRRLVAASGFKTNSNELSFIRIDSTKLVSGKIFSDLQ